MRQVISGVSLTLTLVSLTVGCRSPYYSDRGAVAGGLTGAGIGAALGNSSGNALPAALAGAAIGTITGTAIGDGIDADLARTKAEVESRMGRQMSGAVSHDDVIAMTQAGLSEEVIATHIRGQRRGAAARCERPDRAKEPRRQRSRDSGTPAGAPAGSGRPGLCSGRLCRRPAARRGRRAILRPGLLWPRLWWALVPLPAAASALPLWSPPSAAPLGCELGIFVLELMRKWEGEAPAEPRVARGFGSAGASPSRIPTL